MSKRAAQFIGYLNAKFTSGMFGRSNTGTVVKPESYKPEIDVASLFWKAVELRRPRRVLEAGTLQSIPGRPTHSRANFPRMADCNYIRMDIKAGPDVDFVGDLHCLPRSWTNYFDCFLANAVWEHLERPWIAAKEVARVLAPGGIFFISTHQCFPIHGYPSDFFRFSRDALRLLFEDAGLVVDAAEYKHRAMIVPPEEIVSSENLVAWNDAFPSFIQVEAAGQKLIAQQQS